MKRDTHEMTTAWRARRESRALQSSFDKRAQFYRALLTKEPRFCRALLSKEPICGKSPAIQGTLHLYATK